MMIRMRIRLAGDVVAAAGLSGWYWRPSGPVRVTDEADLPPGSAIALGPAEATQEQVEQAARELVRLVKACGVVAAGAGVELGAGFRSARLAGARGDQRDAVLAALRVLGIEGAARLGDRAGFLVALFGPAVTKRVGAAAAQAMAEGRWAALHLASAASDVLGPEQLEQVLALTAPDGADLTAGGPPSVLAGYLRQVIEPLHGRRRLDLLLDLWAEVSAHHARRIRRDRLLATQGRQDRVDDLHKRRNAFEDELILSQLKYVFGDAEPSLADAARWLPSHYYWRGVLDRLLQDALAATALLRTAVAVSDHGLHEGLARSTDLIEAAAAELPSGFGWAAKRVPGLTGLPARPGSYVRDIYHKLREDGPKGHKFEAYVTQRLARARDYALVVIKAVDEWLEGSNGVPDDVLADWARSGLQSWRERVGYTEARPPTEWGGLVLWNRYLPERESLPTRLRQLTDPKPAEVEQRGDLLWYADLIDALAQLYGHAAAEITPGPDLPRLAHDPPSAPAEPLTPQVESITLAVSGAAQLVALGGTLPRSARTWQELVDGLRADTAIAEALDGEFIIPAPLAEVDGTTVPGTGLQFRLARNARTLAEWSSYMGNCIASLHYIDSAMKGRCGLAALHDSDGRIVVNVDLRPARLTARGWHVSEIQARFNDDPEEALEKRFRRWVNGIPGPQSDLPSPDDSTDETWSGRPTRRRPAPRLLQEVGPALSKLTEQAWTVEMTAEVTGAIAALAGISPGVALTRLRRHDPSRLDAACRTALSEGTVDLAGLWTATGARPLQKALEALDPALHSRFGQLTRLLDNDPLPSSSLRKLVRQPVIAPAYSMELVARRIRAAIGRLTYEGDPAIADAITRRTTTPLLCALVVAVTCRAPAIDLTPVAPPKSVAVPGFPTTTLDDETGPWQQAFPAARELGADTSVFWNQIAEHGLRIPTAWLAPRPWPALWSRAHS